MGIQKKVLLVEDNVDLSNLLGSHLTACGFQVSRVGSVAEGVELLKRIPFELALIDRDLPDGDGIEVCRFARSNKPNTGIIILTCFGQPIQRVHGLVSGADDYVSKPFCIEELVARIQSVIRRTRKIEQDTLEDFTRGKLTISKAKRTATVEGAVLDLTPTEFDILTLLAEHPGKAFSRDDLLEALWGHGGARYKNALNVHITNLRAKLNEKIDDQKYIVTVWGVGYSFAENPESSLEHET